MTTSANPVSILSECADACAQCATACLREKEINMMITCIRLDLDCAEICQLTASFISRASDQLRLVLNACSEICRACAAECEKHAHMEHCRKCAGTCLKCADMCEEQLSLF